MNEYECFNDKNMDKMTSINKIDTEMKWIPIKSLTN